MRSVAAGVLVIGWAAAAHGADAPAVAFEGKPGRVGVTVGGRPFAAYVYADEATPRPYFAHVRAPGGVQVTRTHPPVKGTDATDHDTMHPGLWLAFGDLGGADSWRNKAKVEHVKFVDAPAGGPGRGTFTVRNRYRTADGKGTVCEETCRYTVLVRPAGTLLVWDSTFTSDAADFHFGDQEEMGLGVRMATPLTVKPGGGTITNSLGGENEKGVWGRQAAWCDYRGTVDGTRVGVAVMPDPKNFGASWFHVRDYGLAVANPFGRKSLGKGESSRVVVKKGESLRLRFGVLVHAAAADRPVDRAAAYKDFLGQLAGLEK